MDRNNIRKVIGSISPYVALRKESVDRNCSASLFCLSGCIVALRKESVDRNNSFTKKDRQSSRVALRKESVDRNLVGCIDRTIDIMSLSARRAWIEISKMMYYKA